MTVENTPRVAFSNRTNTSWSPASSHNHRVLKRRVSTDCAASKKRAKLEKNDTGNDQHNAQPQDIPTDEHFLRARSQNCTSFSTLRTAQMRPRRTFQDTSLSSRPVLMSFVSSNKCDLYKLHSHQDPIAPGLPFACAFTNNAKKGGTPLLAVAMQDGAVELLNVTKRADFDLEPQRTAIQIHTNAILDVKWGMEDQRLATSSGDSTTRITCITTQQSLAVLTHHTGSVKSLDWDPNHTDILSTASRDGSICVWDLRTASQGKVNEDCSTSALAPVVVIPHAHCDAVPRGKARTISKTVTSVVFIPQSPRQLISSGSFDGVLKQWDLRHVSTGRTRTSSMLFESYNNPTSTGSRGRGLSSLALGRNHTAGSIWGMAADSCIRTYTLPLSAPFNDTAMRNMRHPGLFVNSFYVRLAASPCGSWLASGSSGGGVYLWDVTTQLSGQAKAVELKASGKEIGAVDWARDSLAACCDDGTVRIWRPDFEASAMCRANPDENSWDWTWATEDM